MFVPGLTYPYDATSNLPRRLPQCPPLTIDGALDRRANVRLGNGAVIQVV